MKISKNSADSEDHHEETFNASGDRPLLCKITSAMTQLAVSRATIYRMVATGQLDLVRISTHSSRITSDSIQRLIRQQALPREEKSFARRDSPDASNTDQSYKIKPKTK